MVLDGGEGRLRVLRDVLRSLDILYIGDGGILPQEDLRLLIIIDLVSIDLVFLNLFCSHFLSLLLVMFTRPFFKLIRIFAFVIKAVLGFLLPQLENLGV